MPPGTGEARPARPKAAATASVRMVSLRLPPASCFFEASGPSSFRCLGVNLAMVGDELLQFAEAVHRSWTLFWPSLVMAYHCMVIAVWCFAVPRVLAPGEAALSVGTFVSFLLYVTMFLQPIDVIG